MKTLHTFLVLMAFLIISPATMGQDLLDALKKTAEMHNEQNGSEESTDNNSNSSNDRQQEAEEWWNQKLDENAGLLSGLTDKHEKCVGLLMLWAYEYEHIRRARNDASNCKMKYDLYGMELLALTSGNFIMYCTEDLYNLYEPPDHYEPLGEKALPFFENYFVNFNEWLYRDNDELIYDGYGNKATFAKKIHWVLENWEGRSIYAVTNPPERDIGKFLLRIIKGYLEPVDYLRRVAAIGEAMEELGCGG